MTTALLVNAGPKLTPFCRLGSSARRNTPASHSLVTRTHGCEQSAVDVTAFGLQLVEVLQSAQASQVGW